MKNPYAVLGVSEDATSDDIKKAFRKLARRLHPDVNPAAEASYRLVAQAYELLSDPASRVLVDAGLAVSRATAAPTAPLTAPIGPKASMFSTWMPAPAPRLDVRL